MCVYGVEVYRFIYKSKLYIDMSEYKKCRLSHVYIDLSETAILLGVTNWTSRLILNL